MSYKFIPSSNVEHMDSKPVCAYDRYIIPEGWSPLSDLDDVFDGETWYVLTLLRTDGYVFTQRAKSIDLLADQYINGIHQNNQWFCYSPVIAWRFAPEVIRIDIPRYEVRKHDKMSIYNIYDVMLGFNVMTNITSEMTAVSISNTLNGDNRYYEATFGHPATGPWVDERQTKENNNA